MSGLSNRSSATYFKILNQYIDEAGKEHAYFTLPATENTPGALWRINKEGKKVWFTGFQNFEGTLKGLKVIDHPEFKKQWVFSFDVDGIDYVLNLGYTDGNAMSILQMLPNVDVTIPFKMTLSRKENDKGKMVTSLFINQNDESIKYYYKKGVNGLPEFQFPKVNGVITVDKTDAIEFLEKEITTNIIPKLSGAVAVSDIPVSNTFEDFKNPNATEEVDF